MQESVGIRRYRETEAGAIGPERLIVMAYEEMVRRTERAALALAEGRPVDALGDVNRVQAVLGELRACLDHEIGGDISRNLEAVYDFMFHENLKVMVDRDPAHLRHNLRVLSPLLEAWRQIPPGTAARAAAAGDAAPGPEPASPPPGSPPGPAPRGGRPAAPPEPPAVGEARRICFSA